MRAVLQGVYRKVQRRAKKKPRQFCRKKGEEFYSRIEAPLQGKGGTLPHKEAEVIRNFFSNGGKKETPTKNTRGEGKNSCEPTKGRGGTRLKIGLVGLENELVDWGSERRNSADVGGQMGTLCGGREGKK